MKKQDSITSILRSKTTADKLATAKVEREMTELANKVSTFFEKYGAKVSVETEEGKAGRKIVLRNLKHSYMSCATLGVLPGPVLGVLEYGLSCHFSPESHSEENLLWLIERFDKKEPGECFTKAAEAAAEALRRKEKSRLENIRKHNEETAKRMKPFLKVLEEMPEVSELTVVTEKDGRRDDIIFVVDAELTRSTWRIECDFNEPYLYYSVNGERYCASRDNKVTPANLISIIAEELHKRTRPADPKPIATGQSERTYY